jgi:hypothetical protein
MHGCFKPITGIAEFPNDKSEFLSCSYMLSQSEQRGELFTMARRKKHSRDTFSFIHVSHPDGFKDKETQNKIRRHAMRAAGQLRLKPPRNPTVSVDIPSNATIIVGQSRQSLFKRPQQQIVPHIAFLGTYPVETSTRARQLIHFSMLSCAPASDDADYQ